MKRALYQQRTHGTKGHRLKVRDCAIYQCIFTSSWPGMLRCIHTLKVEGRQLSTFYAVAVLLLPYTRYDICLLDTTSQSSQNVSVVYVRVSRHLTECLRIVHTKEKERKKKVFRATQCYYTVIFICVFSIYRIDSNREVSLIDRKTISVCSLRDGELAINRLVDREVRFARNAKVNTVGPNACMYIAGRWLNFVFIGFL